MNLSGKMTSSKIEDEMIYRPPETEQAVLKAGMSVKMGGPMTPQRIKELRESYEKADWKHDPESVLLSFVSPCGRWFDCYDTSTSQFYRIDGEWVVNLVTTKENKE